MSFSKRPEPVQVVKQRRDGVLRALVEGVPYIQFLGIRFERRGDELTGLLPFNDTLIGNPLLPALHGGVTAAFLEMTAIVTLSWGLIWEDMESGALDLRSGLPRDAYARARINRSGRRYASVHVEAWQDNRARLFAQATGHFVIPRRQG